MRRGPSSSGSLQRTDRRIVAGQPGAIILGLQDHRLRRLRLASILGGKRDPPSKHRQLDAFVGPAEDRREAIGIDVAERPQARAAERLRQLDQRLDVGGGVVEVARGTLFTPEAARER
jgi:hypothetical protein